MEKNTKILIGIGAVIAAYLILKPKVAVATTITTTTPTIPQTTYKDPCPPPLDCVSNSNIEKIKAAVMPKDYVECPEGFTYTIAGNYGGHDISAGCYPTPSKEVLVDHDPMWGQDMNLILKNITTNQTL